MNVGVGKGGRCAFGWSTLLIKKWRFHKIGWSLVFLGLAAAGGIPYVTLPTKGTAELKSSLFVCLFCQLQAQGPPHADLSNERQVWVANRDYKLKRASPGDRRDVKLGVVLCQDAQTKRNTPNHTVTGKLW